MRRAYPLAFISAIVLGCVVPASGYLKLGSRVGDRTVTLEWKQFPIRYFVTNRDIDGVTAQQFRTAVQRAFDTWHAVPDTQTSSQFVGFTQANPTLGDGATVLGFQNRPDLDLTLAATNFFVDTTSGEIVESDVFFNSRFPWSTSDAGIAGRYDVASIAQHEVGHLLGLSHSALGETELRSGGRRVLGAEAVMFPVAFSAGDIHDRTLKADDIAGISDIYGTQMFQRQTGSVSGTVTKNGRGVLGAHVVALQPGVGQAGRGVQPDGGRQLRDRGAGAWPAGAARRAPGRRGRVELLRRDAGDRRGLPGHLLREGRRRAERWRHSQRRDQGAAEVIPVARRVKWIVACALVAAPVHVWDVAPADAQTQRSPPRLSPPSRPAPHAGSWELSGGLLWQGGLDLGDGQADLTQVRRAEPGRTELFSTASRLGQGVGVQGRLGVYLSSQLAVEAGLRLTRPTLTIDLTDDAESAPESRQARR